MGKIITLGNIEGLATNKNYIGNSRAEINANGWLTYKDAAGVLLPVDGTGGTPTHITFSRTTTAPLGDVGSFLITNSGTTSAQGEGVSYDFTIESKDKAKVLQISFDYIVNSGTFVAGSTGVDSDIEVYIYDVTNAVVIQPSSYKLLSNSTSIADKFNGTFQTASNSTSYRLIFHCPTTATAAWSLKVDNIAVSPSQYVYGTPITDWQSYTPTLSWVTGVTPIGKYKKIGDSISIQIAINVTSTLSGTTGLTFTIPSGLNIDLTKWTTPSQATESLWGIGSITRAGVQEYPCTAVYAGPTTFTVRQFSVAGTTVNSSPTVTQTSPQTWLNGDSLFITVNNIPITGWSSSLQMSDSTTQQVVAMKAITTGVPTGPLNGTSATIFGVVDFDTNGSYNPTTGIYTVGSAGYYKVSGQVSVTGVEAVDQFLTLGCYINTTATQLGLTRVQNALLTNSIATVNTTQKCNAGDTISLRTNTNIVSPAFAADGSSHWFTVERLSGPSAIAATETVACRYTNISGQSIAAGATPTVLTGWTKDYDTHGFFNSTTGVGTVPISGKYTINGRILYNTASFSAGGVPYLSLNKNGTEISRLAAIGIGTTTSYYISLNGSDTLSLNAGDTLSLATAHADATARLLLSSNVYNFINIIRVGN